MKITFTPEIEQLIQEKVNSGKYSSRRVKNNFLVKKHLKRLPP